MPSKAQIRKEHKTLRAQLSAAERLELSKRICTKVWELLSSKPEMRHVHLFLPIERLGEVDTFPLFFELRDHGYTIYTSTLDQSGNDLLTLDITAVGQFEPDSWGIPQPISAIQTSPERIQVVLVPLLAYDRIGNRLGYGKGYYDGFLGGLSQPVYKVGLSFFDPVEDIPAEDHDVRLDSCISPYNTYHFGA